MHDINKKRFKEGLFFFFFNPSELFDEKSTRFCDTLTESMTSGAVFVEHRSPIRCTACLLFVRHA